MSVERWWILLFIWVPVAWAAYEWRKTERHGALLLKALSILAVLLALAEPRLSVAETRMAVSVLVDTSASTTPEDLARASDLAARIEKGRGRHWTRVMPFARTTRLADPSEYAGSWKLRPTAGDNAQATDLEAAIREAIGSMPAGLVPRVVLVSDGNENSGSAARAAWLARQLGVPIDTFPLAGRPRPALRVDSVTLPGVVFAGDRFPVDLVISSPQQTTASVEIAAEGKPLGASQVALERGANQIRVNANVNASGAIDLSGAIRAAGLGDARFTRSVVLRRPKALFLSQDPPGTERHLLEALAAGQFEVDRRPDFGSTRLSDYQIVVLNNWDLESVTAARKAEIEDYVKQGGGLLVIGGERNTYVENKPVEDPLERALPAKLAPPRSPEGTCVVLIVDKSSSMEGRKMELARLASIGVIDNLRPVDLVGVLIFDNSFQWAVPIRKAEDRTMIKRLVAGITPDGGTQIAPALAEAYRKILPAQATYRHIVLLTDGISEEGDSIALSKEAAAQRVTISTVGLGQDVNRAYLERVASFSKGKAYFLSDPSGLEQILIRDVMEHTGSTAVEKPIRPAVVKQTQVLEGVDVESAPPLRGYVKFISKPSAETILTVDRKDPLLSRWQYGLGRTRVFTSDAKSRWAESWVSWKGFDRFWTNVFRDLLPHAMAGEATVELDTANGELKVDYRLARQLEEPVRIPEIYVFGPDGFQQPAKVQKLAEGAYRGHVYIGDRQGLFRIRPLEESHAFPEVGFYRPLQEMDDYGSNETLLSRISEFTGGRLRPGVNQIFDPGRRSVAGSMRLWPGLLGAAIALNLAELVLRKWKGIIRTLRPAAV